MAPLTEPPGSCLFAAIEIRQAGGGRGLCWRNGCRAFSKLKHLCSQLLPEGVVCVWLCLARFVPQLQQLYAQTVTVHHSNVQKNNKRMSLTISWSCVGDCRGQLSHQTDVSWRVEIEISYSIRKRFVLDLPHTQASFTCSFSVGPLHAPLSRCWRTWCRFTWQKGIWTNSYLPS